MSIRENTNRLLGGFRRVAPHLFQGADPLGVLERIAESQQNSDLREFAYRLKELAVADSAVGSIEAFLSFDGGVSRALQRAGFPAGSQAWKFDRRDFVKMSLAELEEFAGRFAIFAADALSPESQARAIEETLRGSGFLQEHAVAVRALRPTMGHNYLLDPARSAGIAAAVERAHRQVEEVLRDAERRRILTSLRIGLIEEEDSRKVLGIQVADVAAAIASSMFERAGKPTRDAARDLKDHFDGVFLNSAWL